MLTVLIIIILLLATSTVFLVYLNFVARFHRIQLFGRVRRARKFNPNQGIMSVLNLTDNYVPREDLTLLRLLMLRKLPLVVCLGDSITHGIISTNYVEQLQQKYKGKLLFVNSGINGNLAYNLHVRLQEDCLDLDPDYVTILIGTNDVNSQQNRKTRLQYIKYQSLPCHPDKNFYLSHLRQIIESIRKHTRARVAILSLPVIGENLESHLNKLAVDYSREIKQLALEYGLTYLPLNEMQYTYLQEINGRCCTEFNKKNLLLNWLLMIGRSFDKIAQINGRYLTYDGLHETTRGAEMIISLISSFLDQYDI